MEVMEFSSDYGPLYILTLKLSLMSESACLEMITLVNVGI